MDFFLYSGCFTFSKFFISVCKEAHVLFHFSEPVPAFCFCCAFVWQTLCEMLPQGVAYLHEGLSEVERKVVEALFNSGAIQVW